MRRLSWLVILTALLVSATPRASSAQNEISATGKGMVGGGLLGAEVIMLTEAAFGEVVGEHVPLEVRYRPRVEPTVDAIREALARAFPKG